MKRFVKISALCVCILLVLAGCTAGRTSKAEQQVMDYLNSLDAQGCIDLDNITEEQLQRLLDAGPDGVEAELQLIADEILASLPTEPVLAPTDEYLKQWRLERDGHIYQLDLSLLTQEDYDEFCQAYLDGGESALEECIQARLADGWDVLARDFDSDP